MYSNATFEAVVNVGAAVDADAGSGAVASQERPFRAVS